MLSLLRSRQSKVVLLLGSALLLIVFLLMSVLFGIQTISVHTLWDAYMHFDGSYDHLVVTNTRVPRAIIAACVGGSLAIAGALMQALTKNPLASPSVFGINAGASLLLVLCLTFLGPLIGQGMMVWVAFTGAGLAACLVFLLGSIGRDGFQPIKLTLAGSAVTAFASAITSGIMLLNKETVEEALFWLVGSVSGRELADLLIVFPYLVVGWAMAFALARAINIMSMGDEVAKGLGQRTVIVKITAVITIVLLAGGSVSVAGPIAFIGIMVPHMCRFLIGQDFRWLLPYCGVYGALLLVAADIVSRFILLPREVPVGVATALLGVPFLVYIARRRTYE
ncbi:MAG TPA: iron ABC transporter permease [Candidatus Bathyarchaeia archaeon]|nr:iron ABC transporter permease [Candidatus Bathyarchaeia archaeon]